MTYYHRCPKCQRLSLRHTMTDRPHVCAHEYHDPADCGICGECRTGWTPDALDAPAERTR